MATKKATTTKKAAPKKSPWKYVGVNSDYAVFASVGPIQLVDFEYCIFPSKEPNNWTSDPDDTRHKSTYLGDGLEGEFDSMFVCEYEDFIKTYPRFKEPRKSKTAVPSSKKQIKFCV